MPSCATWDAQISTECVKISDKAVLTFNFSSLPLQDPPTKAFGLLGRKCGFRSIVFWIIGAVASLICSLICSLATRSFFVAPWCARPNKNYFSTGIIQLDPYYHDQLHFQFSKRKNQQEIVGTCRKQTLCNWNHVDASSFVASKKNYLRDSDQTSD